jgi:hypothetical protein
LTVTAENAGKEVIHKEKLLWISQLKKYILPKSTDQIDMLFFPVGKKFASRKNARTKMTAGKVSEMVFLCLCPLKMTGELFGIEEKPIRKAIPELCK